MDNRSFNSEQSAEAYLSEIAYLLQQGKKIEAIKVYRQATGSDLATARDAIENLQMTGMLSNLASQFPVAQPGAMPITALPAEIQTEITYLLQQNKKIEAIKVYRQATGSDLATSKNVIDNAGVSGMRNQLPGTAQPSAIAFAELPPEIQAEIARLLQQGKKIEAIKMYRQQTGSDLARAKNAVDLLDKRMRTQGF